jgi:hypothetical protein
MTTDYSTSLLHLNLQPCADLQELGAASPRVPKEHHHAGVELFDDVVEIELVVFWS